MSAHKMPARGKKIGSVRFFENGLLYKRPMISCVEKASSVAKISDCSPTHLLRIEHVARDITFLEENLKLGIAKRSLDDCRVLGVPFLLKSLYFLFPFAKLALVLTPERTLHALGKRADGWCLRGLLCHTPYYTLASQISLNLMSTSLGGGACHSGLFAPCLRRETSPLDHIVAINKMVSNTPCDMPLWCGPSQKNEG